MRIFALLAVISLIAACSWRVAPGRSDDPRLTDWCPTSEICIPEADIERFSIPAYAIQQSTLPTEFAMRAGADFGVRDDAVMIAIYPTPSEDMIKFEAIPSQGGEIYEQVLYDEKFGNLITWRVMARSHGRRGGYFYRAENLVYYCNEYDSCNALIHRGNFEASIFVDRESLNKLPALREFFLSMFQRWNQSD